MMKVVTLAVGLAALISSPSAAATIADAAWLEGRWVGEGLGGQAEEVWSPAAGGQMVGHFQLVKGGKPVFYEIMLLDMTPGGLRMRVKHFNADFTAWEDKDKWITFAPDSVQPRVLKFKGLTLSAEGDTMTARLPIRYKDGRVAEEVFMFRRAEK